MSDNDKLIKLEAEKDRLINSILETNKANVLKANEGRISAQEILDSLKIDMADLMEVKDKITALKSKSE